MCEGWCLTKVRCVAVGIFGVIRDETGYFRFFGYINTRRPDILIHAGRVWYYYKQHFPLEDTLHLGVVN